ncbi:hypothetical protein RFI_14457 [Reticulomyxa filosa]|uniref:Uncharacterized protein n=1 Tax=Reticulomyxa filosa TaxID=46433 RepID=X6N9L4_RETFI|nr:hypothetical protein RFI_14457 [Reticulomyxa filosa]|eukprot:ETO22736.1 hypothetical protein RFI_14457 [Reticulomyxa filosa]
MLMDVLSLSAELLGVGLCCMNVGLLLSWLFELFFVRKEKCLKIPAAFGAFCGSLVFSLISSTLFFGTHTFALLQTTNYFRSIFGKNPNYVSDSSLSSHTLASLRFLCRYCIVLALISKWLAKYCIWFFSVVRGRMVVCALHSALHGIIQKSPYIVVIIKKIFTFFFFI